MSCVGGECRNREACDGDIRGGALNKHVSSFFFNT